MATPTQDKVIEYSVLIQRLEASIKRDVNKQLTDLEIALISAPLNFKRLNFKNADKLIARTYQQIAQSQQQVLAQVTEIANQQAVQVVNTALGSKQQPTKAKYIEPQLFGAMLGEWWQRRQTAFANRYKDLVRQAVNQGELDIHSRIRDEKLLKANYRSAGLLVRTSMQSVVNKTRLDTYGKLGMQQFEWVSTLDARTSNICMVLDGLVWEIETKKPIGHDKIYPGESAHWGCRSTQAPVFDVEGGTQTQTRASMDGPVSGSLNYEGWLKTKSVAFQKDILGQTKYRLWKKGKIGFTDLTDQSNNPLTIDEVKNLI